MGIIAWIILGLIVGCVVQLVVGGRDVQGIVVTCLLGAAGALFGGALTALFFDLGDTGEFFNLPTWVAAIAGSCAILIAYNMINVRRSVHR
ncbi:GlsB/YeaQ/YmgE family stress response membrane protein [Nonomuraea sp. NPDC049152]|uniref:GlsB/YeaQ/YmgE family stress response membrane protein n=1 Tax=Nonomuraea sp. NPDC049152 TaxID=3154350 RepID=UPI00340B645D